MKIIIIVLALGVFISGCKKADEAAATTDIQETAQQVGDVMASVDESGGSNGNLASNQDLIQNSVRATFARYAPNEIDENKIAKIVESLVMPRPMRPPALVPALALAITQLIQPLEVLQVAQWELPHSAVM